MHLECGDVVEFDSLIEDMTIFGEDYTQSYFVGGEDVDSGGQEILPYFIITDIKKSQKNVKIKVIQLHKFNIANILNIIIHNTMFLMDSSASAASSSHSFNSLSVILFQLLNK